MAVSFDRFSGDVRSIFPVQLCLGGMATGVILGHPNIAHAVEESWLVVGVGRVQLAAPANTAPCGGRPATLLHIGAIGCFRGSTACGGGWTGPLAVDPLSQESITSRRIERSLPIGLSGMARMAPGWPVPNRLPTAQIGLDFSNNSLLLIQTQRCPSPHRAAPSSRRGVGGVGGAGYGVWAEEGLS
jgi:hypothetical protein